MKLIKINFIIALVMFLGLNVSEAQNNKTETINIQTSSVCGMCTKTIEKALAYERGVVSASHDVKTGIVEVTYRANRTSPEKIRNAINQVGYDADESPADAKAYENLHFCCKKDFEH